MESFVVDYYSKELFPKLKTSWEVLEKGPDMTCFQSYKWYEMLNGCYVPDDTKDFVSVYAVVRQNERTVLIAPLWIVKRTFGWVNKKGVYFLGREGWSDYLNFIYDTFSGDALLFLLKSVTTKYKVSICRFSEIRQNVMTYKFLSSLNDVIISKPSTCVALSLPSTTEEYRMMLSKNARQNVRTAHNRLKKDGIDMTIIYDDNHVDRDKCHGLREQRFIKKFEKRSYLRIIKQTIGWRLTYHFHQYLPYYSYDSGHFLTTYHGEELCSFFYYLTDSVHRHILFIAAGINMKYAKYSPGIVSLNAFINKHIELKEYDVIDFTRGDEPYKYAVGGKDHYINEIVLNL